MLLSLNLYKYYLYNLILSVKTIKSFDKKEIYHLINISISLLFPNKKMFNQ